MNVSTCESNITITKKLIYKSVNSKIAPIKQ